VAIVQRKCSDLTGKEDEPEKFGSLIVRRGPGVDRPITLDVLPEEIGDIDSAPEVFVVEYREPGAVSALEIVCTLKEFTAKVIPQGMKLEDVLENGRGLRGRPPGARNR
jgi:hypothetical protein